VEGERRLPRSPGPVSSGTALHVALADLLPVAESVQVKQCSSQRLRTRLGSRSGLRAARRHSRRATARFAARGARP
jgi:hypothetical protein